MYINKSEIIEHLNADDWQMVVDEYSGMSVEFIKASLLGMWPFDDNEELAQAIYEAVNQ